jgi:hypothetical protein
VARDRRTRRRPSPPRLGASSSAEVVEQGGAKRRVGREPFDRRVLARADGAQVRRRQRAASAVTTPTRRPRAAALAARRRAAGSTSTAAPRPRPAISRWNSARKPQLVGDRVRRLAFERRARGDERREQRPVGARSTTRRGDAPRTVR